MRTPNFLVIGAQKSGTTWLHRFLCHRPDVFVPRGRKELMFFDVKRRYHELGIEGYLAYFAKARDEVAVGEVTPGYLWCSGEYQEWGPPDSFRQQNPERVLLQLGPHIRLIAVLRNPVERALSSFIHHRELNRIPATDRIGRWLPSHGIAHLGFYAAHLARWSHVFDKRQFFVLTYEELFRRPESRVALLQFLGAQPAGGRALVQKKVHAGVGFSRTAGAVFDANGVQIANAEDLETLQNLYAEDVKRLSREWGIDTGWWSLDF